MVGFPHKKQVLPGFGGEEVCRISVFLNMIGIQRTMGEVLGVKLLAVDRSVMFWVPNPGKPGTGLVWGIEGHLTRDSICKHQDGSNIEPTI